MNKNKQINKQTKKINTYMNQNQNERLEKK